MINEVQNGLYFTLAMCLWAESFLKQYNWQSNTSIHYIKGFFKKNMKWLFQLSVAQKRSFNVAMLVMHIPEKSIFPLRKMGSIGRGGYRRASPLNALHSCCTENLAVREWDLAEGDGGYRLS